MSASTFDRKRYAREWQQRRRDQQVAARNASARTCTRRQGAGTCGGLLETHTDGRGGIRVVCPLCERRKRGVCRDCNAPVEGRVGTALRCPVHKAEAIRHSLHLYAETHRSEIQASARASYRKSLRKRRARNEYKRQWRKANRDKVAAQKRRAALRGRNAEHARRHRERVAQVALVPNSGAMQPTTPKGPRTCLTCDTIVRGRVKKCVICKAREASIAREHPALGRGKGWRAAA